jgi:hypothetical protein
MYPRLHHSIDNETCGRFLIDDAHFPDSKPLDGNFLTALAKEEFIWRLQCLSNLFITDFTLEHPLFGVVGVDNAHRSSSLSQSVNSRIVYASTTLPQIPRPGKAATATVLRPPPR